MSTDSKDPPVGLGTSFASQDRPRTASSGSHRKPLGMFQWTLEEVLTPRWSVFRSKAAVLGADRKLGQLGLGKNLSPSVKIKLVVDVIGTGIHAAMLHNCE